MRTQFEVHMLNAQGKQKAQAIAANFDAFQSMGDDRCGKDDYKVYNPGKSTAQKGNFGYFKGYHSDSPFHEQGTGQTSRARANFND